MVRVDMPNDGKLSFQNWHKQMPASYVIYADPEALINKTEAPELNPSQSNTTRPVASAT